MDDIRLAVTSDGRGSEGLNRTQLVMPSVSASPERDYMMINASKCSSMLVTATRSPRAAEVSVNDTAIPYVEAFNLLGVTIQSSLKWNLHIDNMVSKANSRKYFVIVLKRASPGQKDLVKAYCTSIRPVMEYTVHVWHPDVTQSQNEQIERVQKQVLRVVLPEIYYPEALLATGLQTLATRRVILCRNFAIQLMKNPELLIWLARTRAQAHGLNLRSNDRLTSLPSKSQRFQSSPMATLRTPWWNCYLVTLPREQHVLAQWLRQCFCQDHGVRSVPNGIFC